jgi:hypothetical protein
MKPGKQNHMKPVTNLKSMIAAFTLFFLAAMIHPLFAQPTLIATNAGANQYPITFTDIDQRIVAIRFTEPVTTAAGIAGWTITIGGVPVAITGPAGIGTDVLRFQVPAGAITFANRNNVRVTYDSGPGDVTAVLSGLPLASFGPTNAVNNWIFTEDDIVNGLFGENPPVDVCAPVENVEVEYNFTMTRRARYSMHYPATNNPRVRVAWQAPGTSVLRVVNPAPEVGGVGSGVYRAIATTTPDQNYPDNTNNCAWTIAMTPYIWGSGTLWPNLFAFSRTVQIVIPNYKLDNGTPAPGTGEMIIFPEAGNPATRFCVGEDIVDFVFEDQTLFDCRMAVESNLPNQRQRWMQFVYGTNAQPRIRNVTVDGTPVTDAAGNLIGPGPGGVLEGPIVVYDPGLGPTAPGMYSLPINHPGDFLTDVAGQRFEVTIRYWGPCNPYDPFDPLSNVITIPSFLELIPAPPAPTAASPTFCFGATSPLTATSVAPGANFRWYSDAALTNLLFTGTPYNHGQTVPGVYNYWVTAFFPVSGCEGPPTEVTMTIREPLGQPPVITGPTNVCISSTGVQFTLPNPPAAQPFGGTTEYIWSVPAGWSIVSGQGSNVLTVDIGGATGAQNVSVIWRYTTAPLCPSPVRNHAVTVNPLPTANAGGNISLCTATPLNPIAMTGASAGGTFSAATWTGGGGLGAWAQNANPALATFTPSTPSGSFIATLTVTGSLGCAGTNPTSTRTISWGQTPTAAAGAIISVCAANPLLPITMAGASATGTYSTANWSGGAALGTWTQNVDPALATFTPTPP